MEDQQMSDLIDRQKAIDDIEECAEIANRNYEYDREQGLLQAREILIEAQPVQPEIIRCKECKYWRDDHTCREHSLVSPMMANEFCSKAEKKENDLISKREVIDPFMRGERKMKEDTLKINVEADGLDEVTEKVEKLADAMNGLLPQVKFKNCVDCKINIYPSQIKMVE